MKNTFFESGDPTEGSTGTSPAVSPRAARRRYAAPLANNPIRQMQQTKAQLRQIIYDLQAEAGNVTEAKAKALFGTAAETLARLVKAFDDYENKFKTRGELNPPRRF